MTANRHKVVTFLEEGFDLYGTKRERTMATITRGDQPDETLTDTVSYAPVGSVAGTFVGQKEAAAAFVGERSVLYHFQDIPFGTSMALGGILWSIDGFGSIDVGIASLRTNLPPSIDPSFNGWCMYVPRINCFVPSWRNLLSNVRWNYQQGTPGSTAWPPAWDYAATPSGTPVITSGTFSLSRLSSGNGSYYLGTSSTAMRREQQIPLGYSNLVWNDPLRPSNWHARGLTLIAAGYFRNANSDANDTITLTANAYDLNLTNLLSASSTITPPTANWQYREVVMSAATVGTLPSGTAAAGLQLDWAEVAGGGTGAADSCATEMRMFVGQFAGNTSTLLANPSFDSGTTASWTVDSGAFVVATAIASPSSNYLQGGAFATSQIHQDYALPTGFEYGTAILRCFRAQTLANDTGEVKVQVLDSLGTVLASSSTGPETLPTLNAWYGRTVYVDTVDGAATIRVIFIATRSLGTGNSGACFDEANLMFAKSLE